MTLIEVVITTSLLLLLIVPIYGLLYQSRQTVAEGRYQSIARIAAEAQVERIRNIAQRSEADFAALAPFLTASNGINGRFFVPGLPKWIGNSTATSPVNMTAYSATSENGSGANSFNGRIRIFLDEGVAASTAAQFCTNTGGGGAPRHDDYFSCPPFTTVPNLAFHVDLDNSKKATGTEWGPVAANGNYRILPIRVEVFWGSQPMTINVNARDMAPKVAVNAVIAPKFNFRRG